ncbi:MAG: MbnP family protein [Saprospiraceae bacterium]
MSQTTKRICLVEFPLICGFFLAGFSILVQGCTTRVEGCLDIAAANFEFTADRPCNDCCTYPVLSVSLSQKWNDRNFSTDSTLSDRNGHLYRISDLKYFLSSWSWKGEGQLVYTVDSSELTCGTGKLHFTPDILVVDSRQFQYVLGTIRESPMVDTLMLRLGLSSDLDCLDPSASETPSILSDKGILWDDSTKSLATIRLVLQKDTSQEIFDTLLVHFSNDISLPYELNFTPGISTMLKLTVDYAKWFSGVDILDPMSIRSSLELGVGSSFSKTE